MAAKPSRLQCFVPEILGLHHMTAICGDAQQNIDFYSGLLGLRLVKLTVNFDDPGAYHLYYGDGVGTPGTILTFFPYPHEREGRLGVGQIGVTTLSVPVGSLAYWEDRLQEYSAGGSDEGVLEISAPDGLLLRLYEDPAFEPSAKWKKSPVPHEHAIGFMHRVTLEEASLEGTDRLMVEVLGFQRESETEDGFIYALPGKGAATRVEVNVRYGANRGVGGYGTVHHIAFRVANDEVQAEWRETLIRYGFEVTPVRDRDYFHSIYFREPGGVLFELATDPPGFATDETVETLGSGLRLPAMHEPRRAEIEQVLPKLRLPG